MAANLADYVRAAAQARPDAAALLVGATRLSWSDVDGQVDAVGAGLGALGLAAGDRVALLMGNRSEFVTGYFGVLRAGLVAVPLNAGLTPPEVARITAHVGASLVVVDRDTAPAARAAGIPPSSLVVVGGGALEGERRFDDVLAGGRPGDLAEAVGGDDDLAVVLYTSGTSGDPRGAMLTHRAMRASVEHFAAAQVRLGSAEPRPLITPGDVVLLVLPLAHVYSLNGTLGAVAREGAAVVLGERFDPEATLRMVREYGVTNIPGVPPMWAAWAQRPDLAEALAGVQVLFSGAAPLPAQVLEAITAATGIPLFEGYGLTEAAPGVTSTVVTGAPKPGSVGRPFAGVEVMLIDDDGDEVEEGDAGEIWVRGENLFSGYWPDGADGPDEEGWYATGDVAYADAEGDLHLVDRRKELVIVNGFNVYPREVEDALHLHPGVAEAAVVAVPDERTGEAVKAFLVARPGISLDIDDVQRHCEGLLARFKRPTMIEVVPELPHSATGKVAKRRLRSAP